MPLSPTPTRGPTVLIVEDDENIRELLAEVLEDEAFVVLAAENVRGAKEVLTRAAVDAVVVDLHLADCEQADELVGSLRESSHPPAVLLLSSAAETATPLAKAYGLTCLAKPFDLNVLLEALRLAVRGKTAAPTDTATDSSEE